MKTVLLIAGIEIILILAFLVLRLYKGAKFKSVLISILKGWIERAFLTFGLVNQLIVVIVFFSALKLGTRIHEENTSKVSNDQFLIGNILSVSAAIIYWKLITETLIS